MEEYLEGFIQSVKTDAEIINTSTALLVMDAFEQKLSIDEFCSNIDIAIRTKPTGVFLCDFEKNTINDIISLIELHGGIYETNISLLKQNEDNEVYAAFSSPENAYKCLNDVLKK